MILDGVYLRTRAECSAAIMRAVEAGRGSPNGGAYLDMTANKRQPRSGPYFMRSLRPAYRRPTATRARRLGKSAAKCEEPWEVRPGAHYLMGGVRVDADGASVGGEGAGETAAGIAGLFAAGQAMGGVFGANRLGSTSLTEGAVFGIRAGKAAAANTAAGSKIDDAAFGPLIDEAGRRFGQKGNIAAATLKLELQRESWDCIGPVRTAERLDRMDGLIADWSARLDRVAIPAYGTWNQAFIEFEELRNMLETARLVSIAARERDGSLGGHVRLDCGEISAFAQPYSTVVRHGAEGEVAVRRVARPRTPLKRLVAYKLQENWRKVQVKMLRLMPPGMQDKQLEKRYPRHHGRRIGA